MAILPLDQSIPRFQANEDRVNVFVNGDESASMVTTGGQNVPSVRKLVADKTGEIDTDVSTFLATKNTEINLAADGILAQSTEAAGNAEDALEAAVLARDKAFAWAEAPEDVEVEPDQFSAKHHATKAEDAATRAETAAGEIEFPVSYVAQTPTAPQQTQARANLGLPTLLDAKANVLQPFVAMAAAATMSIGTANSENILGSGVAGITSFGDALAGTFRRIIFTEPLVITRNEVSLLTPTGGNLAVSANDEICVLAFENNKWRVLTHVKALPPSTAWEYLGVTEVSVAQQYAVLAGMMNNDKYTEHKLVIDHLQPTTDQVNINMEISVDGGANFLSSAIYTTALLRWNSAGSSTGGGVDLSAMVVANSQRNIASQTIDGFLKFKIDRDNYCRVDGRINYFTTAGYLTSVVGARLIAPNKVNAIRFRTSGGNISAFKGRMYGRNM